MNNYTVLVRLLVTELLHLIRVGAHPEHLDSKPILSQILGSGDGTTDENIRHNFLEAMRSFPNAFTFRRAYLLPGTQKRSCVTVPAEKLQRGLPTYFGFVETYRSADDRRNQLYVVHLDMENVRGFDPQTVRKNGIERDIARHTAQYLVDRYLNPPKASDEAA